MADKATHLACDCLCEHDENFHIQDRPIKTLTGTGEDCGKSFVVLIEQQPTVLHMEVGD